MSSTAVRWCDGLRPVTATVWCENRSHRITWSRGKVVLEDHHLGAEQAMVALGGSVSACVRVLQRWRLKTGWDVPQIGFRSPGAVPLPPELLTMRELTTVRAVERAWTRRPSPADASRLTRTLRRHALAPLLDSVRAAASRHIRGITSISDLDVQLATDGRGAVHGWMDAGGATATLVLPPSWLYRVWARELAFIDGHLVTDIIGDPDESVSLRVEAVRWLASFEGAHAPAIVPASAEPLVDGGWALRWSDELRGD